MSLSRAERWAAGRGFAGSDNHMEPRRLRRIAAAAAFAFWVATLASSARAGDDTFSLSLTPYAWLPGAEGTVGVGGFGADVDASVVDIVDASDELFGVLGRVEGRFGRLGFYADGGYMRIGIDGVSGRFGLADVDVDEKIGLVDFGLMYRLVDERGEDSRLALDATVGARYWAVKLEIDPANVVGATRDEDWLIPTAGLRGTIGLGRRWEVVIGGDVGGLGAGSDFSWSAIGTIGYTFNVGSVESSIFAGYKAIADDFDAGAFTFDATLHGPVIGWRFTF